MCAECRETRKLTLVAESVAGVESVAAEPVRFVVDQDERRIPGGAGEEERSAAQKDQPGTGLNTTGLDQLNDVYVSCEYFEQQSVNPIY